METSEKSKGDVAGNELNPINPSVLPTLSSIPSNPSSPSDPNLTASVPMSLFDFLAAMSSATAAPAFSTIQKDLNIKSNTLLIMVLSIYFLGRTITPFFAAPLSEIFERLVVLQSSNLFYIVFNTIYGAANSQNELIAFRFLAGMGGAGPQTLGTGIDGGLFQPHERGKAQHSTIEGVVDATDCSDYELLHCSASIGSLNYVALSVGTAIAILFGTQLTDTIYKKIMGRKNRMGRPEFRLPVVILGATIVPIGLFIWKAGLCMGEQSSSLHRNLHWHSGTDFIVAVGSIAREAEIEKSLGWRENERCPKPTTGSETLATILSHIKCSKPPGPQSISQCEPDDALSHHVCVTESFAHLRAEILRRATRSLSSSAGVLKGKFVSCDATKSRQGVTDDNDSAFRNHRLVHGSLESSSTTALSSGSE
ncbi:uncharacterized protein PAC_10789 [Phialocephala subalpina]|uniref:Uncharacterized protein n=1 Tax=Phialocephala subalpina TaxID=576137 RepID=A0A1L7X798_9HELO|nr:uncharacterized protein PAC_10789 [Phialocephala subalpina]